MDQQTRQRTGVPAYVKSHLKIDAIKSWIPSRGNVVLVVIVSLLFIWTQNTGVFARSAAQSSGYTRPFPYQGRLADAAGNPLTNTYPMIFRLYTGDVGGEPLWEENWSGPNSVEVSDGLFSVRLGSLTPIPESVVNNNNNLWLGITVGTDDEMEPRIQLGSVPYSHMAQNVPDGSITADKINDGAVTTGKVLDNSITTNKVVNGSITLDKIADNTVNSAKIVDGSISNADIANGSITTTKLAVGAASHITLLSEPITVVSFHSRTTERTALNLSAIVPASAVGVIINLETNGKAYAWVPGTNNASLTAQDWGFNQGWVRLVNQSIDYQMIEGSTSGSDLLITVVGYLE